jgi:peptidoglycan/xylan/chitin deacetylase (PgdA/CDA1 family)
MSLAMSLRSRGPVGSAARTAKVLSRFGATASAMSRRLDRYERVAAEHGAYPTWPTTACVLARNPDLLKRYAERGAELAVHGLVHGDHALLERDQQRESIARALEIFERRGIPATGFRGPYLRYNGATLDVLRELGFLYHSSQAVVFPVSFGDAVGATPSYELVLKFYGALDSRRHAVTPKLRDGIVDIPVAVPDDEILIERLRLDESARDAVWLQILELTHARGDLFTLQLHPERIPELGGALGATLAQARRRQPPVFIARLDEIARWWLRRAGFALSVTRSGAGRHHVRLVADDDATLLVRGLDVAQRPWHGRDALCDARSFDVVSPRAPIVGVSRRSPASLQRFLAEEGLPFEISDDQEGYGAFVDVATAEWTEGDIVDAIDRAAGPLVRLWRWPNGARSALAVTGDIDALTIRDFALRSWETRGFSIRRSQQ